MTLAATPPPLDVQRFYVEEFDLRALDEYSEEREISGAFDIDFDIEQHVDEARAFRISMHIDFAEHGSHSTAENAPYMIHLSIVGFFMFAQDTPVNMMDHMIHVNGTSILYGIARGFVGQATGSSRHGQFVLPAVNFIELLKARSESADSTATPKELPAAALAEDR